MKLSGISGKYYDWYQKIGWYNGFVFESFAFIIGRLAAKTVNKYRSISGVGR